MRWCFNAEKNPGPGYLLALRVSLAALLAPAGCSLQGGEHREFAEGFADPPMEARPMFRWWWPHGLVDPAEIVREVEVMAAAGFGGAEIADVHHSVSEPLDPAGHGWGTEPWKEAVRSALRVAEPLGFQIDLTVGPSWPAALPTIDPNHPAAMQELAVGFVVVEGGERYSGAVPPARMRAHGHGIVEKIRLVQLARLAEGADLAAKEIELVPGSVVPVPFDAATGRVEVSAPDEGRWLLLGYWLRGSGQRPERGPHTEPVSYVVDHFGRAGAEAIIAFWETEILDVEMRRLLAKTGGAFFEDSIEMETDATLWTPGLPERFEARFGYSVLPYLPLIVQEDEDPIFRFAGDIAPHVEHDWWLLMSELMVENHFRPLQEWAHSLGMELRAQPYGLPNDAVSAAAFLDVAEGESLGFKNLDDYRSLAGGREMAGKRLLSNEAGAFAGSAYSTTWKRVLETLNPIFTAGVNQTVLHGFAYAEVPGVAWPGFAAFTPYGGRPGYAEAWGPRQPSWEHMRDLADYFARVQWLLQAGVPQVDVAFLRQKGYAGSGFGAPWFSKEGSALGWTHAFVSPATLELPSAVVRDGRLASEGAAFRLLVFEGDAFHRREATMPVPTARKLLELARAGLPMLVIGDWGAPRISGLALGNEEVELAELFAALLAEPTVVNVPSRETIPEGIARLGMRPRVAHDPAPLVHAERRLGDLRLFCFSAPPRSGSAHTTVWIEDEDGPYAFRRLDPWTGEISLLSTILATDGTVGFELEIPAGSLCLVGYGPLGDLESLPVAPTVMPDNSSSLRKPPLFLTGPWELEVEDWQPGDSATEIRKVRHTVTLEHLQPWTAIPGLEDVSGLGRYRTTIEVEADSLLRKGAWLFLGQVFDTVRVRLNGERLPPVNPLDPKVFLGDRLKAGANTLEIEVSTTLLNRLRVSDAGVYGGSPRQDYGLLGPVVVRPASRPGD